MNAPMYSGASARVWLSLQNFKLKQKLFSSYLPNELKLSYE